MMNLGGCVERMATAECRVHRENVDYGESVECTETMSGAGVCPICVECPVMSQAHTDCGQAQSLRPAPTESKERVSRSNRKSQPLVSVRASSLIVVTSPNPPILSRREQLLINESLVILPHDLGVQDLPVLDELCEVHGQMVQEDVGAEMDEGD